MQICHASDCFLTGGLAASLFAAWLFWYWHSTTWACSAAPWDTTSTPRRQREAASQTREERCLSRESSAWIQAGEIRPLCCSLNNIAPPRLHICVHTESKLESVWVSVGAFVYSVSVLHRGVGISFIFSWVLMGVVTIIFLAGGNMEKLVCEPFHTKEVFKASRLTSSDRSTVTRLNHQCLFKLYRHSADDAAGLAQHSCVCKKKIFSFSSLYYRDPSDPN